MDIKLAKTVQSPFMKKELPNVEVGDTITVKTILRNKDGEKRRTQDFKGIVIAIKSSGISKTVTVRKVSNGIGVERIFPMHSTNIEDITINRKGKTRRSKIYFMRDRIGKQAMKVAESTREVKMVQVVDDEFLPKDESEATAETENEEAATESQTDEKVEETKEEANTEEKVEETKTEDKTEETKDEKNEEK